MITLFQIYMHTMNGWMDEWMGGWVDEWMDGYR